MEPGRRSVHLPFTRLRLEKTMKRRDSAIVVLLLLLAANLPAVASENVAMAIHSCLGAGEARDVIAENHLITSTIAMGNAAQKVQADALAGRLCRWNQQYVYEITLLRRDGRVIHAFVEALTGKIVGTQNVE